MSADLRNIPLSAIRESEILLRKVDKTSEKYVELVDSIRRDGVINAINVRPLVDEETGETVYAVTEGNHRYHAACDAGLEEIPAQVMDMEDGRVREIQIIGNIHRVETRPADYSKALRDLLELTPTLTMSALADKLSQSPTWLSQRLNLLNLNENLADLVNDGVINVTNAYALSKLPPEEQDVFSEDAQTMSPSEFVPKCTDRVKELKAAKRKGDKAPTEFSPTPHMRNVGEIKSEFNNPTVGDVICQNAGASTAEEGFRLAVAWTLHMDEESIAADRQKFAMKQAEQEEKREKARQQRAEKKARDAKVKGERLEVESQAIANGATEEEVEAALKEFDDRVKAEAAAT